MCGIFAICHSSGCSEKFDANAAQKLSARQKHRGPDFRGIYQHPTNGNILCHERLAIMDLQCVQPIQGRQADHQVIHNGEIYNHAELHETYFADVNFKTKCDSEILVYLYELFHDDKAKLCNLLHGIFGFAIIYENEFFVARDPIGIKQLYYGRDEQGRYFFSSEMKVIEDICGKVELRPFPPGHYFTPEEGFVQYYEPNWLDYKLAMTKTADETRNIESGELAALKNALIESTHRRLMSDAPLGVLLSGGLDSSLISAIAARRFHEQGRTLNSFSIGLDHNAPDVVAARKIAKFLGTKHHELHFSIEEGVANIKNLIWHLESYDVTTIRASTPMFFLSKHIHELGIKTVLSGEGADEIFGGYLYFHNAPNAEEFQKELIRRVIRLPTADCLRADKSCMANSLEVRVPFLDKKFLEVAMLIDPHYKQPKLWNGKLVEKWILRKAFDDEKNPFIPSEILWRQKEQFSDGVGYNWIDQLIEYCGSQVSDTEMKNAAKTYPHNTPATKEAYFIRKVFHEHFPSEKAAETVFQWIPTWQENKDPSGRASKVHTQALNNDKTTTTTVGKTPTNGSKNGIKNGSVPVHRLGQ